MRRDSRATGCSTPSSSSTPTTERRRSSRRSGSSVAGIAPISSSSAALELAGVERLRTRPQLLVVLQPQPRGEALGRERAVHAARAARAPRRARRGRRACRASGTAASARPGSSSSARRSSASPPAATSASASEGTSSSRKRSTAGAGCAPDELGDDLAVLERLHGRDALDPVARLRDARVGVRVELGQRDLPVARADGLLEHRRQRAARPAPGGPEVDDDGQLARALDDVALEGLVGDVVDHAYEHNQAAARPPAMADIIDRGRRGRGSPARRPARGRRSSCCTG